MEKTTTAERLKQLMKERGLTQSDIITLTKPYSKINGIEINKANMSMYVSGKVAPAQDKLYILGLALNVSEAWLMGFDVPKERPKRDEQQSAPAVIYVDDLTEKEIEEMQRYKKFLISCRDLKEKG